MTENREPLRQGFLAHRLPLLGDVPMAARLERNKDMLSRCLNLRTTVAVVGAGCSKPLGYPLWKGCVAAVLGAAADSLTGEPQEKLSRLKEQLDAPGLGDRIAGLAANGGFPEPQAGALAGLAEEASDIERSSPTHWMFALGRAQKVVDEACGNAAGRTSTGFHDLVAGIFHPVKPRRRRGGVNPYNHLLDLPIKRFVTTNYDTELEIALAERWGIDRTRFGVDADADGEPPENPLSLTQEDEYVRQLTRFALAGLSTNDHMVFHCHGRWDRPGSLIASERDYQRWYLTPREDGLVFRHSIDLLFSSNPLLFVGYGLGDEDLMRPLRVLNAREPWRRQSRPIFALMDFDEDNEDELRRAAALYDRFGVQVVPYERKKQKDRGLSDGLKEIRARWRDASREWWRKPPPRIPLPFQSPHGPAEEAEGDNGPEKVHANMDILSPLKVPAGEVANLTGQIRDEGHKVIGLIGPPGCSKSWHAVKQVKDFADAAEPAFADGIYYWNAHYANEALTTLDRMGRYMTGDWRPTEDTVLERLRQALRDRSCLLVIDGCERLMRATDHPLRGQPTDQFAKRLFGILSDSRNRTTILLVGRLWPSSYESEEAANGEREGLGERSDREADGDDRARETEDPVASEAKPTGEGETAWKEPHLIPVELESIHKREAIEYWRTTYGRRTVRPRLAKEFSGLCALLGGHNFTLHLAFELISRANGRQIQVASRLRQELEGARPDRRSALVTQRVLENLAKPTAGLAEPLLALMTTSLNAMSRHTIELCLELADKERKRDARNRFSRRQRPTLDEVLGLFGEYNLLIKMPRMESADSPEVLDTYTVHASLRSYFFTNQRGPAVENVPSFPLTGVMSGGLDADRRQTQFPQIRDLFLRIVLRGEKKLEAGERSIACDLCRDAFGILRARMEATTVPRWGRFSDYTVLGARLIHLAKAISHGGDRNWGQLDSQDLPEIETPDAPLYLAELAWLYNDMAVALALEGSMTDAEPTFMLADDFARMIEPTGKGGPTRIQILLNLAHTLVERGQLPAAERYLTQASHMNVHHGDEDFEARLLGYKAFLNHLRGNLQDAKAGYKESIEGLKRVGNVRARSYFYRRSGALQIHLGQINSRELDTAALHLTSARILAGEGDFPDLEIDARIGAGVLHQARGDLASARLELNGALKSAIDIGSRRLEAEAYCRLARVAKRQGDLEGASRNATRSIRIANECGLSLRRTHALMVLGLATVEAGQIERGQAYLRQASQLADRQQYWIRQREADEELQRLEVGRGRATRHSDGIQGARRAL